MDYPPADSLTGASPEAAPQSFGPVRLEGEGFRVAGRRLSRKLFRYEDVTHLGKSRRSYGIGMPHGALIVARTRLGDGEASAELDTALRERLAGRSGGLDQLRRIDRVEELLRRGAPRWAVQLFIGLCLVAWLLQLRDPFVTHVGSFSPELFVQGEFWRIMTANLLHDRGLFPLHLGLNLICLFVFGTLVERALGSVRTLLVMGSGAVGAMLGATLAGYSEVIGASGVAAALAGAVLCVELEGARSLPVWWRIPRRSFFLLLMAQGLVDLLVPAIAAGAHLGGFFAGYGVTRLLVSQNGIARPPDSTLRRLAALLGVILILSIGLALPLVQRDRGALERHGLRILQISSGSVRVDNELAWRMVTEAEISPIGMEVAATLARRAADRTGWRDPNVLDTLAEALFVMGDVEGALEAIDRAISLSRGHRYFVEQRRRFSGERDPNDRPTPPGEIRPEGSDDQAPFGSPGQDGGDSESVWI